MAESKPEQQQIDHWLKVARETIDRRWVNYDSGFYEKEDLPIQNLYTGLASDYADLARAQFLNGEPPSVFRTNFSKGVGYIIKNYKMAYDKSDPDYVGDQPATDSSGFGYGCVDWGNVVEDTLIEGIHYAFMGADFESAQELVGWFHDPAKEHLSKEITRYGHALKHALRGEKDAAKDLLKQTLDEAEGKKIKSPLKLNYLTLSMALYGILDDDEELFNEGLEMQLALHQSYAQGEAKDTDEEFVCDEAMALANYGLHCGLQVTIEHNLLPKGLLIQS